jgi:hypothetical protein
LSSEKSDSIGTRCSTLTSDSRLIPPFGPHIFGAIDPFNSPSQEMFPAESTAKTHQAGVNEANHPEHDRKLIRSRRISKRYSELAAGRRPTIHGTSL